MEDDIRLIRASRVHANVVTNLNNKVRSINSSESNYKSRLQETTTLESYLEEKI